MKTLTVSVPSPIHGALSVTANVEPGNYEVETILAPNGIAVACTLALLEEIEEAIEFELQCAEYDEILGQCEDPALVALYF